MKVPTVFLKYNTPIYRARQNSLPTFEGKKNVFDVQFFFPWAVFESNIDSFDHF